ncbi:hypothetical protein ACXM1Q_001795 [Streptococcus sp. 10F2]
MNWLVFAVVVLSLICTLLNIYLYLMFYVNLKRLDNQVEYYKKSFIRAFGWDEWDWSTGFEKYRKEAKKNSSRLDDIESLPIIQAAVKARRIENLNREKEKVEAELGKLGG